MTTREKIKERFLIDSVEHGAAFSIGDNKKANRLHKKLHDLYNHAKEQGQVDVFSESLNDINENVRLWSALFTLKYNPELAVKVLEKLSKESNIKMTAEMSLRLWMEGKMDLL